MIHKTLLSWKGKMEFETELNGHKLTIDAGEEVGGENKGVRPKILMLTSLAGCTGMDVISILRKMKIEPDGFDVKVDGTLTDEHPKYYKEMKIIYEFTGKDLPYEKLKKAVELSQDKYCGVSALYKKALKLDYEIKVNQ